MKAISAAFVKAQQAFGPALKSNTNPHFRSKYADLSACVEAVIDGLNSNGIALMQINHPSDDGVIVETIFIHESGEQLSAGKLHVPAAKKDAQGFGSALTYARRYGLMAACGIAPEDDDGGAASKKKDAPKHTPTDGAIVNSDRQGVIASCAAAINDRFDADDLIGAYEEYSGITDAEEKIALWKLLPSHVRSALKKHGESLKGQA